MQTLNNILDQIANEAVRIYNDYPQITIFEAINLANQIIDKQCKGVEIIEDTN